MINKKDKLNRVIIAFVVAVVISTLLAQTGIPILAILAGIAGSLGVLFGTMKYSKENIISDVVSAVVGSQIGWAALLI